LIIHRWVPYPDALGLLPQAWIQCKPFCKTVSVIVAGFLCPAMTGFDSLTWLASHVLDTPSPPLPPQPHNPSRGETKGLAHVIIKYHVKPSAHKAFLDAWAQAEEATGGGFSTAARPTARTDNVVWGLAQGILLRW
jgi:hypothetical protein